MAPQSNASLSAIILAALSCLLIAIALPQVSVAWLTAPAGLDHTHAEDLNAAQRANYLSAYKILPQPQILYALSDTILRQPNITTIDRDNAIEMLGRAAASAPGNTHIWYLLAAALGTEMFDANRRALWDHAMSMSLLTGPFARDLTLPRAVQITEHWDIASPDLKNLWQEQTINLWGADPNGVYKLYGELSPVGQKIMVDTLGEVPTPETED